MDRSTLMILALWATWAPPTAAWLSWLLALPWCAHRPTRRWPTAAGLALLCVSAGIAPAAPSTARPPTERPGAVALVGVVRRPPTARTPWLDVDGGRITLTAGAVLPEAGTRVRVTGRVAASGRVTVVDCETLAPPGALAAPADRIAAACRARFRDVLPRRHRGLVEALVLGERRDLPDPVRRAAIDAGTAHLLALSGLHVALVAAWLSRGAPALGLPPRLGTGLALTVFVATAGARPPLVRAATTWALGALALAAGRTSDALDRLGVAAVTLAAWSPDVRDDLGARLSFCAVAGLVATGRALPRRLAALAPVGAFVATAPLCVETFGFVQPLGVVWSWFLGPLVALVMGLGLLVLFAPPSAVDPWLGAALSHSASALETGFTWAAAASPAPLRPSAPPWGGWVTSVLVVALLLAVTPRRRATWEDLS